MNLTKGSQGQIGDHPHPNTKNSGPSKVDTVLDRFHHRGKVCQCWNVIWIEDETEHSKSFLVSKYVEGGARLNAKAFASKLESGILSYATRDSFRLVAALKPPPTASELRAMVNNYQVNKKEHGLWSRFKRTISHTNDCAEAHG